MTHANQPPKNQQPAARPGIPPRFDIDDLHVADHVFLLNLNPETGKLRVQMALLQVVLGGALLAEMLQQNTIAFDQMRKTIHPIWSTTNPDSDESAPPVDPLLTKVLTYMRKDWALAPGRETAEWVQLAGILAERHLKDRLVAGGLVTIGQGLGGVRYRVVAGHVVAITALPSALGIRLTNAAKPREEPVIERGRHGGPLTMRPYNGEDQHIRVLRTKPRLEPGSVMAAAALLDASQLLTAAFNGYSAPHDVRTLLRAYLSTRPALMAIASAVAQVTDSKVRSGKR